MRQTDFQTVTQIANGLGLDPSGARRRLEAAEAEGRIARNATGRWHAETAREILAAEADPARIAGHNHRGRGSITSPELSTLSQANAEKAREQARKIKLENAKRAGELVALEDVKRAGENIVVRARSAFLTVGRRVSDKLLGIRDRTEIERVIEDEVRAILRELASPEEFIDSLLGLS